MSKASEWAKFARKLPVAPAYGTLSCVVLVNGEACLTINQATLAGPTAVQFARWILDTFGDES